MTKYHLQLLQSSQYCRCHVKGYLNVLHRTEIQLHVTEYGILALLQKQQCGWIYIII